MTHARDRVAAALALVESGLNDCEIGRRLGISRRTILDWRSGRVPRFAGSDRPGEPCHGCQRPIAMCGSRLRGYSYLLGLYVGDGCISAHPRGVFRLRILLDRRYPKIVRDCAGAMVVVIPTSRASVYPHPHERADEVSSFSKHWPCFFPQHGAGLKHERRIELTEWQREVTDLHPWHLLRGLIHSDGCRFSNPAITPKKTYRYPRYCFSNRSADIWGIFCEYCDRVGVEWRQMNAYNVSVAKRRSVELMDRYIGPKR